MDTQLILKALRLMRDLCNAEKDTETIKKINRQIEELIAKQ
jgi:hypothetical protein